MKIKLAMLEMDENYLQRIVSVFGTKYGDKLEIYSFTELEAAMLTVSSAKIDVFIANNVFDINVSALPEKCGFAYLVDSADVNLVKDQKAVCKFQKAELIYKQILDIYSEKAGSTFALKSDKDNSHIILFDSISGGTGASSMAAACALHFAAIHKRVLYLNLERFGSSSVFFAAEGQFDISDVIYAVKSRKANLALKLESCVRKDSRGVFYYAESKIALDMIELNSDDIVHLISEIKMSGLYDYIIIDTDFAMDKNFLQIYLLAHSVVWTGDGSEVSNEKISRAYTALSTLERDMDVPLTNRLFLIYNKFSNKTGKMIKDIKLKDIGGAPRYEHANTNQILSQLSQMTIFDTIN